ncbi:MAG: hypothetical protein LIP02_09170 [Bacteroidales bacterium]|nr:hypothetical protein [Bacteroidales bacterium]
MNPYKTTCQAIGILFDTTITQIEDKTLLLEMVSVFGSIKVLHHLEEGSPSDLETVCQKLVTETCSAIEFVSRYHIVYKSIFKAYKDHEDEESRIIYSKEFGSREEKAVYEAKMRQRLKSLYLRYTERAFCNIIDPEDNSGSHIIQPYLVEQILELIKTVKR